MQEEKKSGKKELTELTQKCQEIHGDILNSRLCIIDGEFRQGFELMKDHPRSITIFGSVRLKEENPLYGKVRDLAEKIANLGYTVVTGGGYGLMGAANEGAHKAEKGSSLGINIELPFEQTTNPYLDDSIEFHHFFSRKVILAYSAETYIYCPGGFGTLDEMFEILTLKQTGKIPQIPIILYGSEFWKPLDEYFRKVMLQEGSKTIHEKDLELYTITDDDNLILDIIKNAPVRTDVSTIHHLGQK